MGIKEKVTAALQRSLHPDYIHLEEDEGLSGFIVSAEFKQKTALDRQILIDDALRKSADRLSKAELRQILAIAALTPAEFAALGDSHLFRRANAARPGTSKNKKNGRPAAD